MKNNCEEIKDNISAYLDNELFFKDRTDFEAHMSSCDKCRVHMDEIKKIITDVNSLPEVELPENFHDDFMKKLSFASAPPIDLMTKKRLLKSKSSKASRLKIYGLKKYATLAASLLAGLIIVSAVGSIIGNSIAVSTDPSEAEPFMAYQSEPVLDEGDTTAGQINPTITNEAPAAAKLFADVDTVSSNESLMDDSADAAAPLPIGDYSVKNFDIDIVTDNFDAVLASVDALPGYSFGTDITKQSDYSGDYARITRRVGLAEYEATKNALNEIGINRTGKVLSQSESEEKINDVLSDLNIKLTAKNTELSRLNSLLENSQSIEVLVAVSGRLNQVSTERDDLKSQIISYENQASNPYVNITVSRFDSVMPVTSDYLTFGEKIKNSFIHSANICLAVMEGFLMFISFAAVPLMIVLCAVVIYLTVKRVRGDRDEK